VPRVPCRSALQRSRLAITQALAWGALSIVDRGPYFLRYRRCPRRLFTTASSVTIALSATRLALDIYRAAELPDTIRARVHYLFDAAIAPAIAAFLLITITGLGLWVVDRSSESLARRATDTFLLRLHRDNRIQRLLRHAVRDAVMAWLVEEYPRWAFRCLAQRCTELAKIAVAEAQGGE
jgi:hypothetical protein